MQKLWRNPTSFVIVRRVVRVCSLPQIHLVALPGALGNFDADLGAFGCYANRLVIQLHRNDGHRELGGGTLEAHRSANGYRLIKAHDRHANVIVEVSYFADRFFRADFYYRSPLQCFRDSCNQPLCHLSFFNFSFRVILEHRRCLLIHPGIFKIVKETSGFFLFCIFSRLKFNGN